MTNLTKCFCLLHTDDECFYVGLGHQGLGARKGQNFAPNNYQPFQCCPTKVQKTTKVPKMSARRIGYDKSDTNKQEQKPSSTFKFADEPKKSSKKSSKSEDEELQQPVKVSYKKTQSTKSQSDDKKQTFTPVTSASKATKPSTTTTTSTQTKSSKPSVDIKGNKKRAPANKDAKLNVNNGMFDDIVKKYMFW